MDGLSEVDIDAIMEATYEGLKGRFAGRAGIMVGQAMKELPSPPSRRSCDVRYFAWELVEPLII